MYIPHCLNPYSTGSWVAGKIGEVWENPNNVLILILLEVGLLDQRMLDSVSKESES